jgi:ribosomal protein L11 methyltransferase
VPRYWTEIEVTTTVEAAEAVAEVLQSAGCQGVIYHDPNLANDPGNTYTGDLLDEKLTEISADDSYRLSGYLPVVDGLESKLEEIREGLKRVGEFLPLGDGGITLRRVAEENWAEAWKAYFHPEVIGRVVIRPTWEKYRPEPGQVVIDLDPGMAFGTGTHPSTRLCMELLQDANPSGLSVLDLGTGSGILAIAAAKLGSNSVTAVDIDPVAVKVAQENAQTNQLGDKIRILQGDLVTAIPGETYDLVVANIIASVIVELLPQVPQVLKPNGCFIAAGIIDTRASEVEEAVERAGLRVLRKVASQEWVAYMVSHL